MGFNSVFKGLKFISTLSRVRHVIPTHTPTLQFFKIIFT